MHLKQLKLSGFKSFVDPTVIPFPSQLVAVLGPNGCGKSNIIDAVRWVLGESSTKNLRTESMTDVIFNGSSERKPVGQAQVELLFDNSLGRLVGEFGRFKEISIKRVVSRDGDSTYYLNGTKCRRRDITDLFLGTGAGAQGYSIIGQGTISKIIDAKPEELRGYFEEAAGVSKYKERRKETLSRIHNTKEHLARLSDIRQELDKQLERLSRQAKAAIRFKALKEEERQTRLHLHQVKKNEIEKQLSTNGAALALAKAKYEEHRTLLTHWQEALTTKRQAFHVASDELAQFQAAFYALGTEIARLEQQHLHASQEKARLHEESQRLSSECQEAKERLAEVHAAALTVQEQLFEVQDAHQVALEAFNQANQALKEHKEGIVAIQTEWLAVQSQWNEKKRQYELEKMRGAHFETERNQLLVRLEGFKPQMDSEHQAVLQEKIEALAHEKMQINHAREQYKTDLNQVSHEKQILQAQHEEAITRLYQLEQDVTQLHRELAAAKAQHAALRKEDPSKWDEALQTACRVYEQIDVEPLWRHAVEYLLGQDLHGLIIENWAQVFELLPDERQDLVLTCAKAVQIEAGAYPRLLDKIHNASWGILERIKHVYAAPDLETAREWFAHLQPHESVVTPDGLWLGEGFIVSQSAAKGAQESLLLRQQKIASLQTLLEEKEQDRQAALAVREQLQGQLTLLQQQQSELQAKALQTEGQWQKLLLLFDETTRQLEAEQAKAMRLQQEFEAMEERLSTLEEERYQLSSTIEQLFADTQSSEKQVQSLSAIKQEKEDALRVYEGALAEVREQLHQLDLKKSGLVQQQAQQQVSITREQQQLIMLENRLEQLNAQRHQADAPGEDLQARLTQTIKKHAVMEEELAKRRDAVSLIEQSVQELERLQAESEIPLRTIEAEIQSLQVLIERLTVVAQYESEAILQLGPQVSDADATVDLSLPVATLEEQLQKLTEKIKQLGAINLVAIDEYEMEAKRKEALDVQCEDLTKALSTLESAIVQMDKETSSRLLQTFEEVNQSFSKLFPRLFGGGHAQLLLTCDNLLEAGIVVMAQPPGKRNSTIQLLSGGEKAMTAVALIFAIFQLNPSPFCMLDEVDAPLDDVNVGRFCELVREMSDVVQFLFITHNKVTMALAEHLIGVTMREPGVSRVVTVNIEEALSLAE